jgi:hypothetical protein
MTSDFKRLESPSPWGDYGSILVRGMTAHLPRKDGLLQLERTGPLVPAITFPGRSVVATDEGRMWLEENAPEVKFRPVLKARIVKFDWSTWDWDDPEPEEYPKGGEPENYILSRRHSGKLAEQIGDCWECIVPEGGQLLAVRDDGASVGYRLVLDRSTWNKTPLFRANGTNRIFCTERLSAIVSQAFGKWIELQPAESYESLEELEIIPADELHSVMIAALKRKSRPWWKFW